MNQDIRLSQDIQLPTTETSAPRDQFPWPPGPDDSILLAFFTTLKRSALSPTAFFRAMPVRGGLGAPVLFYLAIGFVVAVSSLFWKSIRLLTFGPEDLTAFQALGLSASPGLLLLLEFLLSPLSLLLALFLGAGVTHLMLLIVGGAREGFEATTRALAFAYSPLVLAIVPMIGPIVGTIWATVNAIIGLREAHRTDTWRAVVAVLGPIAVVFFLVFFVAFVASLASLPLTT
ncbi:MAG TPA: YIP1 family protein [Longimicrobiales bacterium]